MVAAQPAAATAAMDLDSTIGVIAGRLLSGMAPADESTRQRLLLERALEYAARAEHRIALQEARIAQLESASVTDELTGLLNRRGFLRQLEREVATARRYGVRGALLYCDLDRFKAVNDTLGHGAGDAVLRHTARLLAASVRKIDIIGRIGGDEFGLVMVQADARSGAKRAQAIQWLLQSTPCPIGGTRVVVRASIGVQEFTGEDAIDDLMCRADMAMYDRKRRRNRRHLRIAAE